METIKTFLLFEASILIVIALLIVVVVGAAFLIELWKALFKKDKKRKKDE